MNYTISIPTRIEWYTKVQIVGVLWIWAGPGMWLDIFKRQRMFQNGMLSLVEWESSKPTISLKGRQPFPGLRQQILKSIIFTDLDELITFEKIVSISVKLVKIWSKINFWKHIFLSNWTKLNETWKLCFLITLVPQAYASCASWSCSSYS